MIENPFRVFKNNSYLVYWIFNTFSLLGSWVDFTLRQWLIVELIKNEKTATNYVGIYNLIRFLPSVLLSFVAGYINDKFNPKWVLVIISLVDLFNACLLSYLLYTNNLNVFNFVLLGFMLGLTSSFYFPARSKLINELVKNENDIPASFSWQGISFNLSRIIGPVIAGYIAKYWGIYIGFILNAISYIPLIVYLLFSNINFEKNESKDDSLWKDLKNTWAYIKGNKKLLKCFYSIFTINFWGISLMSFLQIFVKEVLEGNVNSFSYLISSLGAGAIIGAFIVASIDYHTILYFREETFLFLYGLFILLLSFLPKFALWLIFFVGIFQALTFGFTNNKVQLLTNNEILGRVMGIYAFFNISLAYLGIFFISKIGYMVGIIGLFKTVSLCIIFSAFYIRLRIKEEG